MPKVGFVCPDNQTILIEDCFRNCRMNRRCATMPYLELIAEDRKWRGVTPSMAGTGPRQIYLKDTCRYSVIVDQQAFMALGTTTHGRLSLRQYTENVLSEESFKDEEGEGTPDCLEQDEFRTGYHILSDYKTWGSYKVAKALGMTHIVVPLLDHKGKPVMYVRGKKKGSQKYTKKFTIDPRSADVYSEALQTNRYRIMIEESGFPISRIQLQAIVRDGGTWLAEDKRGLRNNIYMIDIPLLQNEVVLKYYKKLSDEVEKARQTGYVRRCSSWETWRGLRCELFCDVYYDCELMGK
jgi:hypothetical protein